MADDDALHAVTLGEHGILAGLPHDGIHVDMSTVFPDTSKHLAQLYRERGADFIAAPVSGRPERLFEKSSIGGTSSVHWRDDCHTIPYRPD